MKKKITLLIFVLISISGFGQEEVIRGNQYKLKGKIINEVSLPADCGTIASATVIEFKISKFSKPDYPLDSIGVIVSCPEGYGKDFFEVGKTYQIELVDENQANFEWAIINKDHLKKYNLDKKLWVTKATKEE